MKNSISSNQNHSTRNRRNTETRAGKAAFLRSENLPIDRRSSPGHRTHTHTHRNQSKSGGRRSVKWLSENGRRASPSPASVARTHHHERRAGVANRRTPAGDTNHSTVGKNSQNTLEHSRKVPVLPGRYGRLEDACRQPVDDASLKTELVVVDSVVFGGCVVVCGACVVLCGRRSFHSR